MNDINKMEHIWSWSRTLCETPIQSVQLGAAASTNWPHVSSCSVRGISRSNSSLNRNPALHEFLMLSTWAPNWWHSKKGQIRRSWRDRTCQRPDYFGFNYIYVCFCVNIRSASKPISQGLNIHLPGTTGTQLTSMTCRLHLRKWCWSPSKHLSWNLYFYCIVGKTIINI